MKTYRDSAILRKLVLEKLDANRSAIRSATENKGPALSTMASSGEVLAGTAGGLHRPIGHRQEGQTGPIWNGKTGAAKAPASALERQEREPSSARGRPVLRLIIGSSKRRGVSTAPLRLVL